MAQLPPGVDPSKVPFIPPPAGQLSNFINPPSLAPVIEAIGGILVAVETILLALRTCSNFKTFGKLRFEDCIFQTTGDSHQSFADLYRLGDLCGVTYLWVFRNSSASYAIKIRRFPHLCLICSAVRLIALHAWDVPLTAATEALYKVRSAAISSFLVGTE